MDAGLNIFQTYGYSASGSDWKAEGEYPIAAKDMVWSWDMDSQEPIESNGSCAIVSGTIDNFHVANCSNSHPVACRKSESYGSYTWPIGNSSSFNQGDNACSNIGSGYVFATPRNKAEQNDLLLETNSTDTWINYSKSSGSWTAELGE